MSINVTVYLHADDKSAIPNPLNYGIKDPKVIRYLEDQKRAIEKYYAGVYNTLRHNYLEQNTLNDLPLTIGTTTNNTTIEEDGTITFNGDATVYNDIYIGLTGAKVPAANTPTWATFTTNTSAYTFDVNDYIDINPSEMLHNWKEGSDIELHLHWATNGTDANERAVKWQIYFSWGDMNEAFSAEQTASVETIIAATDADLTHKYSSFGSFSGTGFKIGSIGTLRLKRITSTGTAPSNDPFGLMVGVHYEIDTIGSRSQLTK